MDPRLTALYASYKHADPAPTRVKPLPIQVLHRAQAIASPSPLGQATIDMAWLAFFFLLRPGEYCAAPDNHPCLRAQHLPVTSPLCTYVDSRPTPLTTNHITTLLRAAARSLLTLGFAPNDVNARSLRAGGAMALLCVRVDADTIRLVGHWRSDAMFRYLHAQALPLIRDLSRIMLTHGAYTLLPGTDIPQPTAQLVAAAPPPLDG